MYGEMLNRTHVLMLSVEGTGGNVLDLLERIQELFHCFLGFRPVPSGRIQVRHEERHIDLTLPPFTQQVGAMKEPLQHAILCVHAFLTSIDL